MTRQLAKLLMNLERHSHGFFDRTSRHLSEETQDRHDALTIIYS